MQFETHVFIQVTGALFGGWGVRTNSQLESIGPDAAPWNAVSLLLLALEVAASAFFCIYSCQHPGIRGFIRVPNFDSSKIKVFGGAELFTLPAF